MTHHFHHSLVLVLADIHTPFEHLEICEMVHFSVIQTHKLSVTRIIYNVNNELYLLAIVLLIYKSQFQINSDIIKVDDHNLQDISSFMAHSIYLQYKPTSASTAAIQSTP